MAANKHIVKCREILNLISDMANDFAEEYQKAAVEMEKENKGSMDTMEMHSVGMSINVFNPGGKRAVQALIGSQIICEGLLQEAIRNAKSQGGRNSISGLASLVRGEQDKNIEDIMSKLFKR